MEINRLRAELSNSQQIVIELRDALNQRQSSYDIKVGEVKNREAHAADKAINTGNLVDSVGNTCRRIMESDAAEDRAAVEARARNLEELKALVCSE